MACSLKFHWYLRTLILKFQKATIKIKVFQSLPCLAWGPPTYSLNREETGNTESASVDTRNLEGVLMLSHEKAKSCPTFSKFQHRFQKCMYLFRIAIALLTKPYWEDLYSVWGLCSRYVMLGLTQWNLSIVLNSNLIIPDFPRHMRIRCAQLIFFESWLCSIKFTFCLIGLILSFLEMESLRAWLYQKGSRLLFAKRY